MTQAMVETTTTHRWRWVPAALPTLLFAMSLGFLLFSLTWTLGDATQGQLAAQKLYLKGAVLNGSLAYGAWFCLRRQATDPAWRLAAWGCTLFSLLLFVA